MRTPAPSATSWLPPAGCSVTSPLPPPDGPYSPEATAQAADLAAEAIRYLALATRDAGALADPAGADRLIASLYILTGRLPQVCAQISARLALQAATGTLGDDHGREPSAQALIAGGHLGHAGFLAGQVTEALQSAQNAISGLYVKEDGDE